MVVRLQCMPLHPAHVSLSIHHVDVTSDSLSSILFKDEDILKIIHCLDINKAHEYDDVPVRLLKIMRLLNSKTSINNF